MDFVPILLTNSNFFYLVPKLPRLKLKPTFATNSPLLCVASTTGARTPEYLGKIRKKSIS